MVEICYLDEHILVCVKPARVLSTDEPGGLPELLRQQLGEPDGGIWTVHRLDRVVSGLMVLARNSEAASELSRQVREGEFQKTYRAVLHGVPPQPQDTLVDLLGRDKARKMTYVAPKPGKGIQQASLSYQVLSTAQGMSLVEIQLHTGRTHQIRVQFASRGLPLVGSGNIPRWMTPVKSPCFPSTLGFTIPKQAGGWSSGGSRRRASPGTPLNVLRSIAHSLNFCNEMRKCREPL